MKKLLLFDYGGVIQNSICSEYTWKDAVNEMIAVCNPENANILKLYFDESYPETIHGKESDICLQNYLKKSGSSISIEKFQEHFSVCIRKIPVFQDVIDYMISLAENKKCDVGIFSNQFALNKVILEETIPLHKLQYLFLSAWYGYCKPDRKFYELVEKVSERKPEDILFIDDHEPNLSYAKVRGWNTLLASGRDTDLIIKECSEFLLSEVNNKRDSNTQEVDGIPQVRCGESPLRKNDAAYGVDPYEIEVAMKIW